MVAGSSRNLPYPLRSNADIESETPTLPEIENLTVEGFFPLDADEPADIVLSLSLNEYVALATCIDVGRDIAYGDNSIVIWWTWIKALKMGICDAVEDCIDTSSGVQRAITNVTRAGDVNASANSDNLAIDVFSDGGLCDDDSIYGYCGGLWQYIDSITVDVLERVAEATNLYEQLSTISNLIPLFNLLPFDDVFQWISQLGNYGLEVYNASKSVAIEDEIVCELFCIAKSNGCHLTMNDVLDYFIGKIGGVNVPTALATFGEWVTFMALGVYTSDRIIYLWSAFQLSIVLLGSRLLDNDLTQAYALHARAGDPSSDWTLLCDPCLDLWQHTFDFTAGDGSWLLFQVAVLAGTAGEYISTIGWSATNTRYVSSGLDYRKTAQIYLDFGSSNITRVKMNYSLFRGSYYSTAPAVQSATIIDNQASAVITGIQPADDGDGNRTLDTGEIDITTNSLRVRVVSSWEDFNSYSGSASIESVTVYGTGVNPFI